MKPKKAKALWVPLVLGILLLSGSTLDMYAGEKQKKFELGGAFLGVFNSLDQQDVPTGSEARRQFDYAANIDFLWNINRKMRVTVQFQLGSGEGSLGLGESSVAVTDLNLEVDVNDWFTATIGSFDTPFGWDTPYLTNNGDTSNNPLVLNSLFYSAFAGTNTGTLNTLGVKGEFALGNGTLVLAVTNGTDEASLNPDGNFEIVVSAQTPPLLGGLKLGGSYIASNDRSESGSSGSASDFKGWMVDGRFKAGRSFSASGYYGQLTYGDQWDATDDDVTIWKAEFRYDVAPERFYITGRISDWNPGSNGINANLLVPNPGFNRQLGTWAYLAQKIRRFEAGVGYFFNPKVLLKAQWFFDDYQWDASVMPLNGIAASNMDAGTRGFILALNVLF